MRTIFAFGDSYTYGHGLKDCWVKEGDTYKVGSVHSQYAWPSLLATDLGYNLKNYSRPGISNLAILHKILNTNLDVNSVCVIMWSYYSRDMIFNKDYSPMKELFNKSPHNVNKIINVGNWIEDEISKNWMLAHNDTDLIMRSWFNIHHANLFFEKLKVPHYNVFVNYPMLEKHKPMYCKIPFRDISVQHFIDNALDGNHPGPLTHQRIAKDIKQCLIEDSII